ncbi:DNA topology modulation protein FlaR [Bacillus sp. REN3]|uniref:DNA topology modulation protein FlaR n=1 Tax=Bacillus sp. REN3 TaxID=2802440 RepID=UPI001AEDB76C|nr:DNA topology modulation protein FlaR [Bacillus sp. REN3]
MKKIHIIGSVGSGKTTLARIFSKRMDIPCYELDNVVWKRSSTGDVRRSEQERDKHLGSIIDSPTWIVEGVHYGWVGQSFRNADLIILLDPPFRRRTNRIIKRFILQKLGLEKANYEPTFGILRKMFAWNRNFEVENRAEIMELLKRYEDKLVIVKDNSHIEEFLALK